MYPSLRARVLALLISYTLVCVLPLSAQDAPQTRPRRVNPVAPTVAPDAGTATQAQADAPRLTAEPLIRIGLATDARSATISTTGRLLNASDTKIAPAPLEVARVRVEPRPLPSLTDSLEGSAMAAAADESAAPSGNQASEKNAPPREAASRRKPASGVKLASRSVAPVRGAIVYATGTTPLFDSRAPLVFASEDEALHPLKYNEKAYRGRLEVFPNARGTLTVVNVVGLEDYVRGVVPNELSPGGFPALEALKAQAVAARTYAVSNRGQFARDGFDLLPTTRSQVYGGLSTEHPLTDRAVAETRGRVATYKGRPINALYTSTCGGRTEHGEHIFGGDAEQVSYLRARECASEEQREALAPRTLLRTTREPAALREAEHATSARDAALLSAHNFQLPTRLSDEWLAAPVSVEEVRALVAGVATLARQSAPAVTSEAVRPPAFATALAHALDGESRGDVLLARADVEYLLVFRDADEIPANNRADVAQLLREGHLSLYTDATLRPRQTLSRARVLRAVAHACEARGLLRLHKATTRLAADGGLLLRPSGKGADRVLVGAPQAYLFRAFGDALYQVRELTLVGGEAVVFHTDARGEVDYLEVRPAQNGAASDRFSSYANWTVELTPAEVASRLARTTTGRTGALVDLRVRSRGASRRALDLEVIGTQGSAHVTGGRIRTALGLREQLFVIERRYDETGRVAAFIFQGRGWGHGVGMCQVGAYGLARAGLSYDKILKSYYTGINVTRLY
ncbi:MAG TPA: SpoIID/LytB domain-containing protein [Pyrinomonadaceae bacterium]|nr:SpoIID/LytB domain-containing protein [Pyrinomonadaceae bacterium]